MTSRRFFGTGLGAALAAVLLARPVVAQFSGPRASEAPASVAAARAARIGAYVTLEGSLVERLGEDTYSFTDGIDTIRVEIEPEVFGGRQIGPETRLRITGEIDFGLRGRYVWVSALEPL